MEQVSTCLCEVCGIPKEGSLRGCLCLACTPSQHFHRSFSSSGFLFSTPCTPSFSLFPGFLLFLTKNPPYHCSRLLKIIPLHFFCFYLGSSFKPSAMLRCFYIAPFLISSFCEKKLKFWPSGESTCFQTYQFHK